jgi:hypothetical protein
MLQNAGLVKSGVLCHSHTVAATLIQTGDFWQVGRCLLLLLMDCCCCCRNSKSKTLLLQCCPYLGSNQPAKGP